MIDKIIIIIKTGLHISYFLRLEFYYLSCICNLGHYFFDSACCIKQSLTQ